MTDTDLTAIRRSLGLILLVLVVMGLYFAKEVILPILMGMLLALTLSPLVRTMQRYGLAPAVTATALILLVGVLIAGSALMFSGPISNWINDAPGWAWNRARKCRPSCPPSRWCSRRPARWIS